MLMEWNRKALLKDKWPQHHGHKKASPVRFAHSWPSWKLHKWAIGGTDCICVRLSGQLMPESIKELSNWMKSFNSLYGSVSAWIGPHIPAFDEELKKQIPMKWGQPILLHWTKTGPSALMYSPEAVAWQGKIPMLGETASRENPVVEVATPHSLDAACVKEGMEVPSCSVLFNHLIYPLIVSVAINEPY